MNSTNEGPELIAKSASTMEFGRRIIEQVYVLFSKLWLPVQLTLAAGGLVIAVYYGNALRLSLLNTHSSLTKVFAAKLEPTRSTDQGISAILLSGVKDEWARPENLNRSELNSILQELNKKVQEETAIAKSEVNSASKRAAAIAQTIKELDLKVKHPNSPQPSQTWEIAIVSQRQQSFMVIPAMSLRRKSLDELPLGESDRTDHSRLISVLEHNPEVRFDLNLAAKLEPIMRKLDNASGERLTVIQTYFITESGVFLIRAKGVNHQGDYYGKQFQPYTQYMDRPYFWGAVDAKQSKPSPFDYRTKPYLDLGGNGFVVTFSKKFDLPNGRVGVVCVDAKLPNEVTDEIERHLENLGAKVSDFYLRSDTGIEPGKDGPLPKEFSWFVDRLRESREAQSDLGGNISTPGKAFEDGNVVRFTVPIGSDEYGTGIKRTRLLWVAFDSGSVLGKLTMNLALFTAGIILVIAVTWSLFWDYAVLKREMSNVLEKMSKVMKDASTPFVWLNEKNEFVKVNRSMLTFLGHRNINELMKQSLTFRGLLTDASQQTYDEILENSGAGRETGEYEISIITKSGEVLHVRAHGERIPYPTWWKRGLPHRFGIFVEVIELGSITGSNPPINVGQSAAVCAS